jgi:hypothetical protein
LEKGIEKPGRQRLSVFSMRHCAAAALALLALAAAAGVAGSVVPAVEEGR